MKAILMLEDGYYLTGEAAGANPEKLGEVIFNTAVVGYQEAITDPANAGKIVVFTYPLIGNYGVADKFYESKAAWVSGIVVRDLSRIYSNWQARHSFDYFVKEHNLFVLSGVDTRILAVHLREHGQMSGILSVDCFDSQKLLNKIKQFQAKEKQTMLPEISVEKQLYIGKKKAKYKLAVLDLGITNSIIKQLECLGCSLRIFPYNTQAADILQVKPDGVIISGGPEEDSGRETAVKTVRQLLGKLPILGIATGNLVLSEALGAKITKMKLGHHGVNYAIKAADSQKGQITAQNHSFVINAASLKNIKDVKITAQNLNDLTVEEIESKRRKFIGVQYCPLSPGFAEVNPVFPKFLTMLTRRKHA